MAAALGSGTAAAMAVIAPASASQAFRCCVGATTSPPGSPSKAVASPAGRVPSLGAVCTWRVSPSGLSTRAGFQRTGIERIAVGISRDSSGWRISALERGAGDPLYFVSDDYSYNEEGPIELQPREIEIDPFAIPDASPAQIVASICLTGAIVLLSYRALRKRAARSKEMTFRSSGIATAKSVQEEARKAAIDSLKQAPEVVTPPPSPLQTLFGAVVAGGIALGLYKFTSTVESGFSVKAVSQDYSIRNLTITVRTIITGLCYLATFVFAANSIGLTLYAFQLALGLGVPDPVAPRNDSVQHEESNTEGKVETEDLSEN